MSEIIPDSFCSHVELGTAQMVGGLSMAEGDKVVNNIGMCQECLDNYLPRLKRAEADGQPVRVTKVEEA